MAKMSSYLCIGLICTLFLMGSQGRWQENEILFDMSRQLGMQVDTVVYHHGGRMPQPIDPDQLDDWVHTLAKRLGLSNIQIQKEADYIRYDAVRQYANLNTKMTVVNDQLAGGQSKPYVTIEMKGMGERGQQSSSTYQQLRQILLLSELHPQIHCSIQGSLPVSNQTTSSQIVKQVLQELKASEVESIRTKQLTSVSANSRVLPQGLKTQGGRMNLQIATRVDQQHDRLNVTMGTPIITIEY